jgi:hypothetical protein
MAFDAISKSFIFSPAIPTVGTWTITVTITDDNSILDPESFDITVTGTNDDPVWDSTLDTS